MYSYDFVFYKPGKKFYTAYEIKYIINALVDHGYEVYSGSSRGPHFKGGKLIVQDKEEHLNLDLIKDECTLSLLLGPAEEKFNGRLGQLWIPEEQFEEDPEKNADLMAEAANRIFIGLDALFAWGDHELELGRLEQFLRFDKITALAWVNFFGRELVERFGGLDKVLLFPDLKKSYESKDWRIAYIFLSPLPDDPTPDQIVLECKRRWPGVVLRVGSYPPDSKEAKMLEKMKLRLKEERKIWEKQRSKK